MNTAIYLLGYLDDRDSEVSRETKPRAGLSGVWLLALGKFYYLLHHVHHHSPATNAEDKNKWSYNTLPLYAFMVCKVQLYIYCTLQRHKLDV
jgi:hypothetical protein